MNLIFQNINVLIVKKIKNIIKGEKMSDEVTVKLPRKYWEAVVKCIDIALTVSGRSDAMMDDKQICEIAEKSYDRLYKKVFV